MDTIERYELGDVTDWASLVLPTVYPGDEPFTEEQLMGWDESSLELVPIGYVFVIERRKKNPKWKLPSGHKKRDEDVKGWEFDRTPRDTARHEQSSETGIDLPVSAFSYAGKYLSWKEDHWKCLFSSKMTVASLEHMNSDHPENEGEEPKFFTVDEFYDLVRRGEFLIEHYEKLVEYGLIFPFGRDQ